MPKLRLNLRSSIYCLLFVFAFCSVSFGQDSFSPSHISAGTGSVLTITGSGFGTSKTANNYVEFLPDVNGWPKVRPLASDYVSWSDTKIEVKVPSGAMDGPLYITMDNGTQKVIHPWLVIDYNIVKLNGIDTKLMNSNGAGGYTFHLHNNLNSNNKAKTAFLNAFETWKCATGVNWTIGEPTSSKNGNNIVRILDDEESDYGAVVQTSLGYGGSGNVWYLGSINITFSKLDHWFKFNASEPGLYDFESVALHGLGLGLNLGVVLSPDDAMYRFRKVTETEKRSLSANDISAGSYMVNFSKISSGFQPPMIPLSPGSCAPAYSFINSFSPATARGGEVVTITGANFTGITAVKFGNISAASFTVVSPTTITAVVGSEGASGDITVTGSGGVAAARGFIFINRLPQSLSYSTLPTKVYGDADFDLEVTASTGLPVTFTSNNSSVATVTNNRAHIVSAGSVIITASQAGNAIYAPASVNLNLIVNKADQTITFMSIPAKLTGDPDFNLNAVASSRLIVSYTNSNPLVATVTNGSVHILGTGTTTITAVQSGDGNYNAAPSIAYDFKVSNLAQILLFPEIVGKKVNDADFEPGATVNSGLPITYISSNLNVATIVNNKIHIIGAGTSTITASQEGNLTYAAASKQVVLTISKLLQTINFPQIATKTYNDADFDPAATSSSGLAITYVSSNPAVATIVNGKIHIVGAGTASITATQAGNETYESTNSTISLTVNKLQQTITFQQITLKNHTDADFDLNATASSGLPVSYSSSNPAVATIVAGKVHIVAAGAAVITASQIGNANVNAAPDVVQNLDVLFNIPISNFTLKSTDETCKTSNNGAINIIATQTLSYTAAVTLNGTTTTYPFNSVLTVNNLSAGTYTVCITVAGQPAYKQCFDAVIKEPKDLAVYSSIKSDGNNVFLKLEGGERYYIDFNGQIITTTNSEISFPLIKGNNIVKISTDKTCQGVITKTFLTNGGISLYPNPVKSVLNVVTGSSESVKIDIHALDGRLMYSSQQKSEYGQVNVDLSKLNKGLYVVTLTIGNSRSVHKVIKD